MFRITPDETVEGKTKEVSNLNGMVQSKNRTRGMKFRKPFFLYSKRTADK